MPLLSRLRGRAAFTGGVIAKKLPKSYSADGAIAHNDGLHKLTKGSAGAYTLSAPTAGEEGAILYITADTAFAHVVTVTGGIGGVGAAADVGTFGGAIGDGFAVIASNLTWHLIGAPRNVTFA